MDDMKREIYLLALEKISTYKISWVCLALQDAAAEVWGCEFHEISEEMLEELLPEFFQLYDGISWYRIGTNDSDITFMSDTSNGVHDGAWWKPAWMEPRVRILNYILTCK